MSTSRKCVIGTLKFVGQRLDEQRRAAELERGVQPALAVTRDRRPTGRAGTTRRSPSSTSGSTWTTIIVSERCPPTSSAVPNASACCSFCTKARVSVPMIRKFAGSPFSSGVASRSSRMCVVGISSNVVLEEPVAGVHARSRSRRARATSAIAKRPTKCLNEEPGATTARCVPADASRREPRSRAAPQRLRRPARYSTGRPRSRAMRRRWISLVPSPISRIFASR